MKKLLLSAAAFLSGICTFLNPAFAQSTAFTYQGQLVSNSLPVSGLFDLQFTVYDAATNGNIVGSPLTNAATAVTNGIFTAQLDFGPGVFTGPPRWLQIGVETNGGPGAFAILEPLQEVTSTPYAIQSSSAVRAAYANAVAASNITGTVAETQLPSNLVTNNATGVTLNGAFSGNGSGLTTLNASQLASGTVPAGQLPATVVLNNATGVNLSGTFNGNGGSLTNLNLSSVNQVATAFAPMQTNNYTSADTYTITVPANAAQMRVKLWGAAGGAGNGGSYAQHPGGGGAYVTITLPVSPGQTYVAVVGQGGNANCTGCGGGYGSSDAQGGSGNGGATYPATGGQASSFFAYVNSRFIMKAVAGGGGAGGGNQGGAGGNPGQAAYPAQGGYNGAGGAGFLSGSSYSPNALTIGETNLDLMMGNGGDGSATTSFWSCGGGGGYGGGSGGGAGGGGGGGGSYGTIIIGGNTNSPGNTNDPNYIYPAAWSFGPLSGYAGKDGLIVVMFDTPATTFTGNFQVTGGIVSPGPIVTSSGIILNNPSNNVIQFPPVGVAPPSNTSVGWRINTYPQFYGIGIDSYTQWYSTGGNHAWYSAYFGSYAKLMLLDPNGNLTLSGPSGAFYSTGPNSEYHFVDRANTNTFPSWSLYATGGKAYLWNSTGLNRTSVDTSGNFRAQGTITASTSPDLAETIPAAADVEAGDVVSADPTKPESVVRCSKNAPAVLGVISDGSGGFLINARGNSPDAPLTGKPLVLAGRVPVKVSLENGPVHIGDTLASSSIPGVAMRAGNSGPTIGIALANFTSEKLKPGERVGQVLCFVKVSEANITELRNKAAQVDALEERVNQLERVIKNLAPGSIQ